ncbi:hypothetical protein FZI85_27245 [Mycobacterium sp. CBMA293]|uniref:hypothetical protein n=1 Tax=Mycolicibacterium sp. CBMA 360 TaxID=2606614 RepID=UPI0013968983|nr:hypothetical protein [Mycolicibacterium sp. CBMA 360]MUM14702.1 hypothetical protein [Mycolicibacterium sp. CBMA 293]
MEALIAMARVIVAKQRFLADAARAYAALSPQMTQTPEGAALRASLDAIRQRTAEGFPSMVASLRVALEVYDTFGPGRVTVDEPDEAALWNNKHYVWTQELTEPPLNH